MLTPAKNDINILLSYKH